MGSVHTKTAANSLKKDDVARAPAGDYIKRCDRPYLFIVSIPALVVVCYGRKKNTYLLKDDSVTDL